jgi:hypothetical protein
MAYKNMVYAAGLDIKLQHLLLRAFAAVDQIHPVINV